MTKTPEILIRTPDGATKPVRLERDRTTLGRSSGNELCYSEDHGLSRNHLAFERTGQEWFVRDMGSKNGTLVNGIRISTPTKLEAGDRVSAGHLVISFDEPRQSASNETVIFVETSADSPSSSTVITSLDGLIKRKTDAPEAATPQVASAAPAFQVGLLAQASGELGIDRPLPEMFKVIVDQAMRAVGATRAVLMTLENDELVVQEARGEGFRISSSVRDRVVKERKSLLIRDTQLDEAFRDQLSIVENKVRSFMAVPLQTSEKVVGLLYLDSSTVHEFNKEDLNLATLMANIAAIRIENARLQKVQKEQEETEKELQRAAAIQRGLLPARPPMLTGIDLAGYNAPCRTVGGDYYDFFVYPDGRVAIVVADVAGKGVSAAMLMSSLQARVQVLTEDALDLATMVTRLNRVVSMNCPENRFITFFVAVVDPKGGELIYCNAGHNPPILVRANGSVETLEGGGVILGILPKATYVEHKTRLDPGDVVVLFSDGVTEAVKPDLDEEFGETRLAEVIRKNTSIPASDLIDVINNAVSEWSGGAPAADDVTLVIARRLVAA